MSKQPRLPASTFQVTNESIFISLNDKSLYEKVNNIFDEHVHRVNKRRKTNGAKAREAMLWRQKGTFDLSHGFKHNKAIAAKQNSNKSGGKKIVKRSEKEMKLNRSEIIAAYRKMKAAKNKLPRK